MGDDARRRVAAEAVQIAAGWSPEGAPTSWALTAETFRLIGTEPALLDLAVGIPPARSPPLLLSAALRYLVDRDAPQPLARYYPSPGGDQPGLDGHFRPALIEFARERAEELAGLCAQHRYQMNEAGRSADVIAALGDTDERRPIALMDLGTGAGFGLHVDRFHYRFGDREVGDASSPVHVRCAVVGPHAPPVPEPMPVIAARVGVDIEPVGLEDDDVRAWLAACVAPEIGAVDRFAAASTIVRRHPVRLVRADVVDIVDVVRQVAGELPDDALLVLVDTYVHMFLTPAERARFRAALVDVGRDLDWISVDPLVPFGPQARESVQGLPVPARAAAVSGEGVVGMIGRLSVRGRTVSGRVLGLAHSGASWLEWLDDGPRP